MPWTWYDSTVIKIENQSPTTRRFWLKTEEAIDFKAGQFITMDLPISKKRLQRWRSYSIANAPDLSGVLELSIVLLEGGAGTKYLFEEVATGSSIRFKGPAGAFTLPETLDKDLVLICTGTGVAPFRSMLWDIYHQKRTHKNIHLIFGTRYANGILYQKEFEELKGKIPGFSYSVALSREAQLPNTEGDWEVQKGYVHPIYQKYYGTVRSDVDFYLCGWSNMVDEAVVKLTEEMGYDKSQVHYELYG
ncbi:MAG: FAD-dependent oxidoreductase [Bacteroidota bacterium]